jgi:error-prone DNA polymerase
MKIRLGLCSAYSLLFGVYKPGELMDKAASFGVKAASICDLNNLYGVHSFLEKAKEKGIKPIIGTALTKNDEKTPVYCFVENRAGFGRLCEILTERNKDKERFDPLPLLGENSGGLLLASSDEAALTNLAGRVKRLYAAITPTDVRAAGSGRKLNISPAFIDNSIFLEPEDFSVHKVLRAIALLKTTGNLTQDDTAEKGRVLRSSKELNRLLMSWPEAAKGSAEIAEVCQFNTLFDGFIFPAYGKDPGAELRERVYSGARLRYKTLDDTTTKRIEYELNIIENAGFSPYFLRMDEIVKMARSVNGADRTCGRGSGAASIVSYSLGITNVDPVRHNLYFERFLNPSRSDPPDIDVDFAWDERDDLIKAVIEQFGPEYCARVANHNFFRARSALRETAKAYGFSDGEISGHEKRLFDLRENVDDADPLWKEVYKIAARIKGLPRGLGMHCGGLVITPEPISRFAPIEKSAEGFPLLAWEKEGVEAAGFVKIDLLGNRSLAVIRDALQNLQEQGIHIDPHSWRPIDDKATIEALSYGDSMGVFYIESPAMRQLQKKTGVGDFEHIVIHSSLIRPAANRFISEYVRRLKGGKWEPLHPLLEGILGESYGILCYQEDVSKSAVALAGFNEADADRLRKLIAKKAGDAKLGIYEKQFFEGCRKNGVSEDVIQKVWAMMLSFDGYSFCKPHSASYAMVSFQSAYLRVHHPAEFMAAVLSNQGGYYRPHAYIAEIRRMRLFTLGPDVNLSRWKYYGKGRDVVIGLMAIKGLSVSGAKAVLEERDRGGDFTSLDSFSGRVSLNRDDIVALCPAGVFDSIAGGLPRHLQARRLLSAGSRERRIGNGELFSADDAPVFGVNKTPSIAPSTKSVPKTEDDLWEEFRALGFLRNNHPLALWKDKVMAVKYRVKASRIAEYVGQNVKMIGWSVAQKEVWTKDGLAMNFLSLEDETGLYETVIFPYVYEKYGKLLFDQQPLLVYGRVTNDEGAVSVEVNRLNPLQQAMSALLPHTSGGSLYYGNCPRLKTQENAPDQYPVRISSGRR